MPSKASVRQVVVRRMAGRGDFALDIRFNAATPKTATGLTALGSEGLPEGGVSSCVLGRCDLLFHSNLLARQP